MVNLRSLPLCALAGALLVSSVSVAQTAASAIAITPANRILNPIDDSQLITLKGTVHPLAIARNDRGVAPDSLQLSRMHLVLKRSDSQESALKQLIGEMHTPGSANYHKWLTPDQFAAQFGPSDQDLAAVTTWLTGHGFSVTKVNPGRQTIEISGNVAQLRTAFHTQVHKYSVNGETHYANATNPQIPSALAPVVAGFVSLNNFPIKSYAHSLGKAQYDPKTDKATAQWTIGGSNSYNFVLAPQDYAVQYDLNPLYASGINGSGQTIAIVNDSNVNVDLVNQFRSLFGLPANPPQVIVDGNDPGVDGINNPDGPNYDSLEAYLDVEWAGAVAPDATIDLVVAADTALESGLILAAEHAVYGNVAPIISLSFGNCESALGSSNAFLNALWEQAAAQGITVLVSSGDAGSAGCDNDNTQTYAISGQAVNGFASTPYNVAVGGTDFYYSDYASGGASITNYWGTTASNTTPAVSIKGVVPEQPWNSSQFGLNINNYYNTYQSTTIAGGGGGASNAALCLNNSYSTSSGACTTTLSGYPKPAWQTGVTGIPSDGVRDLPDVSLFASSGINASYYPVCAVDGDCQLVSSGTVQIYGVGGTSASTPAFAGIMALVNQKYGRQGQANTILYPLAKQFPASFHDVTAGTISVPCEFAPTVSTNCIAVTSPIVLGTITEGQIGVGTTPEYNAAAGYDLATGLGTIDANQLVTNWGSVKLATTATTMTPSSTSFAHGTSVTINGTVTGSGTPTGNVALMTDSTEQAQQGKTVFALASGSYTGTTTTLPGGTYNIWAQYGGDAANGLSTSPKTQITVAPEASGIYFNAFSSSNAIGTISGGHSASTTVDYGTQMILSALVAPNAQLSTFETCTTSCPVFTTPTGAVTFSDSTAGSGLPATAVLNAEGDAEFSAPFAVGSHSVTASYAGDQSYNSSTAQPITFTVVKDTPQIFYNSPAFNQSSQIIVGTGQPSVISFQIENTAQYNSSSYALNQVAAPTGTLTYSSSPSGISGSVTLSAAVDPYSAAVEGVANVPLPATTKTGNYTFNLSYSGDSNYLGQSGSISVPIVGTSGTASTIVASLNGGISPNSTLTISGTVTGQGSVAPTSSSTAGTGVLIYASNYNSQNNGNFLGEVLFSSSSGNASNFSFTVSSQSLPQGTNLFTLQYTGDATYAPSATVLSAISNPLSDFTLVPNLTIVPVTAGSNGTTTINLASVNGFSGTLSLYCTAASGITCSIPATATLTSGGNTSATLTLSAPSGTSNGNYNVRITGIDSTGEYIHTLAVTADVSGTAAGTQGFTMTNSGPISIVAGATTGNTSAITVAPTNSFTGNVALSCAVTTSPAGAATPITCSIPASLNIPGPGSVAALLTVNSTAGTTGGNYIVTVTGTSGGTTQITAVSVAVSVPGFTLANSGSITIAQAATSNNTSTITASPTNGFTGAVALTCAATTVPTGATSPVTCAMSPTTVTINSSAPTSTLTVSSTASTTPGAYAVTVTGANSSVSPSPTTVVSVTVTSAVASSFTLSNSGSISVSPGASTGNTSMISVTPSGNFTGTVNLTCAITPTAASDPAACSLSPTSVSITSGALTSTLTITTTAATAFNKPLKLFWPSTGGAVLAVLFFFVPRRRRNWLTMVGLLILVVSGFAIGCGGGGSSGSGGTTPSNPGTTAGSYTVTVTGTSGSTTKTTTVTLTVL